jgi:hypothetical protein
MLRIGSREPRSITLRKAIFDEDEDTDLVIEGILKKGLSCRTVQDSDERSSWNSLALDRVSPTTREPRTSGAHRGLPSAKERGDEQSEESRNLAALLTGPPPP